MSGKELAAKLAMASAPASAKPKASAYDRVARALVQ